MSTWRMEIFDRILLRQRRKRAAARLAAHDFLFARTAGDIVERLAGDDRRLALALDLGSRGGHFARALRANANVAGHIGTLVEASSIAPTPPLGSGLSVVADEEALPFADASFDLIVSVLSLHNVNDLPGALIQIRRALRAGGIFIAALFGGETLGELRRAFGAAESDTLDGASPRVAPFLQLADGSALLSRAGFASAVADSDKLGVTYADLAGLLRDLRGMGETNALQERRRVPLRRDTLASLRRHYPADPQTGRIAASFEIIYLTGWA